MRAILLLRNIAFVCALLAVFAFVSLCAYSRVQLWRAQRLVGTVERITVGKQLSGQLGASALAGDREVLISSVPFARSFYRHSLGPRWFGPWRPWVVVAGIAVEQSGEVADKLLYIDDGNYGQYATVMLSVTNEPSAFSPCGNPEMFLHPGYKARREMRSGALIIRVSPQASPQYRHRAFQLDLSCLNAWQGCKSPGDIAPAQWADIWADARTGEDPMLLERAQEACRSERIR